MESMMILNLTPANGRTYPNLSLAVRAWDGGAAFKVYLGPFTSKVEIRKWQAQGVHRVRFWDGTKNLGEWELDSPTVKEAAPQAVAA